MKKNLSKKSILYMLPSVFLLLVFASCQKSSSVETSSGTVTASAVAAAEAIAVAADSTSGDSVYVVGTCSRGHHTDSIAFSSLPAAIATYLTANYAGYTFKKAYTDKDISGTVTGYVVIIDYNGTPVGLKFDASGTFVKVLEQREGSDLSGPGWHRGGRFQGRGGFNQDTVAVTSLSSAITSYFTANYPGDTLLTVYKGRDSGYVVLSTDGGVFATVFDASGTFVQRMQLPSPQPHNSQANSIAESTIPSVSLSYLTTTYPDYVFKHAFKIMLNGVVQGYVVFIDANNTKYAIEFDASGNFVEAMTIR